MWLPPNPGKRMYIRAVNPVGLARALEVRVGEWMARSICEIPGNQTTARSLTNAGSNAAAIAATLHDGLSIKSTTPLLGPPCGTSSRPEDEVIRHRDTDEVLAKENALARGQFGQRDVDCFQIFRRRDGHQARTKIGATQSWTMDVSFRPKADCCRRLGSGGDQAATSTQSIQFLALCGLLIKGKNTAARDNRQALYIACRASIECDLQCSSGNVGVRRHEAVAAHRFE